MSGEERRKQIMDRLSSSDTALSGSALAKELNVSRQVIVQDIALLRAKDKSILSTNKGYICYRPSLPETYTRIIRVKHSDEQMRDELYTIVDGGAKIRDVIVEHDVYGQITVDLLIESRRDVDEFIERIGSSTTRPLKELTGDIHYHTIDASDNAILDQVEGALKAKGYLILE